MSPLRLPLLPPLQLLLLQLSANGDENADTEYFDVVSSKACVGEETMYGTCKNLEPCPSHCNADNTQDCEFDDWSDWVDPGGCIGICSRQRAYKTENNACGKPCKGAKQETKKCKPDDSCIKAKQNCRLSKWSAWTECGSSDVDQITRTREITQFALNGGEQCEGHLRETKPCGAPARPTDCEVSNWTHWSDCSESCGYGTMTRKRTISANLQNEGKACKNALEEQKVCNKGKCKEQTDCEVGDWGEWGKCDEWYQRTRTKSVKAPSSGGKLCKAGTTVEKKRCDFTPPKDCEFTDWGEWQACDRTCDGGQKLRVRTLKTTPQYGGKCTGVMSETAPCGEERCVSKGEKDCSLKDWGEWSKCSADCGWGVKRREVKGLNLMQNGGQACKKTTGELAKCKVKDCKKQDCTWNEWEKWEPCSVTCGTGFQRRHRSLQTQPRYGGATCDAKNMTEVKPCGKAGSCDPDCIDGEWGDWGKFTECSVKCGRGYKSRTREPNPTKQPNYCGWPATGERQEFKVCDGPEGPKCVDDHDCALSTWTEWDACTATCFGIRTRSRRITQYATTNGKGCNDQALKETEPCSPGKGQKSDSRCGTMLPKKDCMLSDWSAWQKCSADCNGGQTTRKRDIKSPPQNGGKECPARLEETKECGMKPCKENHCIDCGLSKWSSWGACSQHGQSQRTREVTTLPNFCGKKCEAKITSELKKCNFGAGESRYCAWSDWSAYSECPDTCTETRKKRTRTLGIKAKADDYLFKISSSSQQSCFGSQAESARCDMSHCQKLCKPVNCEMGEWTKWEQMNYGLCVRAREVNVQNNECGAPCIKGVNERMEETKACPEKGEVIDCKMSKWSTWSHCVSPEGLSYRLREKEGDPRNGGKTCVGSLKDVRSCSSIQKPVNCSFTDWSSWTECDLSGSPYKANEQPCGTGFKTRTRRIGTSPAAGGTACHGPLQEAQECDGGSCKWARTQDCKWEKWSQWSECLSSLQRYRTRGTIEPKNNGEPCRGRAEEIEGCAPKKQDCELEEWSSWSTCSSQCRGTRTRERKIKEKNKFYGKICHSSTLKESEGCNMDETCKTDESCEYKPWGAWGKCNVKCGYSGQEVRKREIKSLRQVDGIGCKGDVVQTRKCHDLKPCPKVDCAWNDWMEWSQCTTTCGAGQTVRSRHLKNSTIGEGAEACKVKDMRQTAPCSGERPDCPDMACINGVWDDWTKWEPCTATCGEGVTWRSRVIKQEANFCGKPVTGVSQQTATCKSTKECLKDVDCEFDDWSAWSACSKSCDGTRKRVRQIKKRAVSNGKACGCVGKDCDKHSGLEQGARSQIAPCNNAKDAIGCPVYGRPMDCELTSWSAWSPCPVTCGAAQIERTRFVKLEARDGGKPCDPVLNQTGPCHGLSQCDAFQDLINRKVDCQWATWNEWSTCDKCGGMQTRLRQVARHAEYGGHNCTSQNAQEVRTCTKSCAGNVHCAWSEWGAWSDCSITCVPKQRLDDKTYGHRKRTRRLTVVTNDVSKLYDEENAADLEGRLHELYRRANVADSRRWQEISAAFALGCLSFLVGYGVLASRTRRSVTVTLRSNQWADEDTASEMSALHQRTDALPLVENGDGTPRRQVLI